MQKVQISGVLSDTTSIASGVPQGSVLGPLLFLIYINDLPLYVKNSIVDIFADDTTLSLNSSTKEALVDSLMEDLLGVNKWCEANGMVINTSKTKVMYFSSKNKINQIYDNIIPLEFRGEEIHASSVEKILGVNIDSSLSWHDQVESVIKKCNSLLYLLYRIKIYLSIEMRKLFFNAYILPHLDYCSIIWGNCNSCLENKLIRLQKRAARLILDKDFDTPSSTLFKDLNWMIFPERVKFQKAIIMYKIFNGQAPSYLTESFTPVSNIHDRNLRSSSNEQLYVPKPKTELFRKTLTYSGSVIWNSIPTHIRNAQSVREFKSSCIYWWKQSI